MARFPKREAQIAALAEQLWRGLLDNNAIFSQPPIHPMSLRFRKLIYQSRHNNFLAAQAAAEQATTDKTDALEELIEALKDDIRYAENTVNFDDDKLKLIGWAGKKAPTPLAIPGQTRLLEAPKQGKGWLFLDWKAPADGGKPKAYKVQRRVVGTEPVSDRWEDIATAILTEATLVNQPEKIELEYRVIAVNKTGDGSPSNTVMVVL
ncbi:MAG: fibronectin type III domain-containing protein [Planctomycetota bacterium]